MYRKTFIMVDGLMGYGAKTPFHLLLCKLEAQESWAGVILVQTQRPESQGTDAQGSEKMSALLEREPTADPRQVRCGPPTPGGCWSLLSDPIKS